MEFWIFLFSYDFLSIFFFLGINLRQQARTTFQVYIPRPNVGQWPQVFKEYEFPGHISRVNYDDVELPEDFRWVLHYLILLAEAQSPVV